jgi:transposase
MKRQDFCKLAPAAQEALRVRAVYLVLKVGKTQEESAIAVGVSRQCVNIWLRRYRENGGDGLKDGRRISSRKGKGILTAKESRRIRKWITNKCQDQMKLPYGLWTAGVVRDLIQHRLGKNLALSTVQLYLKRWNFTPQKPLSRATERNPMAITTWLKQDYPKIVRRAKREKSVIWWGDETGISNQNQAGRGYAPVGQTPVLHRPARKISLSMISALNNRGGMKFMCFKGGLNADLFIVFLRRMTKNTSGKVFLIVDNLRVHHAVKVNQWVEKHHDKIAFPRVKPEGKVFPPAIRTGT